MAIEEQQPGAPARLVSTSGGIVIGIAMLVANVANYGYQIVSGRFLSLEEYGLFTGLMAVVTVITVATSALQTTAARAIVVGECRRDGPLVDPLIKSTVLISVVLILLAVLLSPVSSRFFNVGSLPLILLGVYVVPAAFNSIAVGRFQGLQRFAGMAVYSAGQAVAKFAVGIAVLLVGLRVSGLVAGLILSSAVFAVVGILGTRAAGSIDVHAFDPDVRRAFAAFTMLWFMLGADVLFARAFFEEADAGLYGAAAVLGKSVLWIPAVVAQVAFPRLAHHSNRGESVAGFALRAGAVVAVVVSVSVAALYLVGDDVFRLLYGPRYAVAADIAWKIGLAVAPLALVNLLVQHFLARQQGAFLKVMVVVVIIEVLALYLGPKTYDFYALVLAAVGSVLLVAIVPFRAWRQHLPSVPKAFGGSTRAGRADA